MTFPLTRTGDIVSLDGFHRDLLTTMLDEEVPRTLTVDHARRLIVRVRSLGDGASQYRALLDGFLRNLETVLAH